jgi:hypothetical protein
LSLPMIRWATSHTAPARSSPIAAALTSLLPWHDRNRRDRILWRPLDDLEAPTLQSGHPARQPRSIRNYQRLSALTDQAKTISGKVAAEPNPHRRRSPHRLPAGSFFGGFQSPAPLPGRPLAPGRHPKPYPKPAIPGRRGRD